MSETTKAILADCKFLVNTGLWSGPRPPDATSWLSNFDDGYDVALAASLLRNFQYLSERVCIQSLKHSLLAVQRDVCSTASNLAARKVAWEDFQRRLLITHVAGERPGPADSGYHYARAARQYLGFEECQIVDPEKALEGWIHGGSVIFLDDFVGSGEQFIATLNAPRSARLSFSDAALRRPLGPLYYCPLICTGYGLERIAETVAFAKVFALFVLDDSYNVLSPESRLWASASEQSAGVAMLRKVASQHNLPIGGFHNLSLALAFHNSTPDAVLPLFFRDDDGWQPLVRRS